MPYSALITLAVMSQTDFETTALQLATIALEIANWLVDPLLLLLC